MRNLPKLLGQTTEVGPDSSLATSSACWAAECKGVGQGAGQEHTPTQGVLRTVQAVRAGHGGSASWGKDSCGCGQGGWAEEGHVLPAPTVPTVALTWDWAQQAELTTDWHSHIQQQIDG